MFTTHQIDCLKKLGIQFLKTEPEKSPKHDFASIEVSETTSHIELPQALLNDLTVLFPALKVDGNKIRLTEHFVWLVEARTTRVIATKTQLITAPFEKLSIAHKKQIWDKLQEIVKATSAS